VLAAILLAACGALVLPRGAALAQPAKPPAASATTTVSGTVVGIDENDLIIDIGSDSGLSVGSSLEIWRPLKLKHPVTGKVLTDRFKIGTIELTQVRKSVSLASPSGKLTRDPEKGDVILLPAPKAAPPPPPEPSVPAPPGSGPPPPPLSPEEEDARAIGALLDSLRGADLETRIRRYEEFARRRPSSKYTRTIQEEVASLRRLASPRGAARESETAPAVLGFEGPQEVVAETPIRIGIELNDLAIGAVLHARVHGEANYRSYPMTTEGKGYFGATIPADRVSLPSIDYFIEASTEKGLASAVAGTPEQPREIDVLRAPKNGPPDRAGIKIAIMTDYADFNRLRNNDRAWVTEGYFGMRFGDTGVRALRTGFGVYRGIGGSVEELDEKNLPGRPIGLTYGYLEGELGIVSSFAFIARASVGLLDEGISGGGQLLMRIGNDQRTNLVIGGELLGGVGLKTIAQLELNVFPRFPILLRSETTNQPAGTAKVSATDTGKAVGTASVGVRAIAQVGVRIVPSLTISARGSVQGRNIRHAGPGFGGGLSYEW